MKLGLHLRCESCGRFLGAKTALFVKQWHPGHHRYYIAPGVYDARCAAKVPATILATTSKGGA